jgi:hypothetical protein
MAFLTGTFPLQPISIRTIGHPAATTETPVLTVGNYLIKFMGQDVLKGL